MAAGTVHFTLDLEHDYAGVAPYEAYETLDDTDAMRWLADLVTSRKLELTVFATGRILDHRPRDVEFFANLGAEFCLHSYSHALHPKSFAGEVDRGHDAFVHSFGRTPAGYRSPGGVTGPDLFGALEARGIEYDSSIVPSFRPGFYANLAARTYPHRLDEFELIEVPMSVLPGLRVPVSASYVRVIGFPLYRRLADVVGLPSPLVYLFHLVDVIPSRVRSTLPTTLRHAYARGEATARETFTQTVDYILAKGFTSRHVRDTMDGFARTTT